MMVNIVVMPFDGCDPVTKSMAMWDQGRLGMDNGCNRPDRGRCDDLFLEQTEQATTYSFTSLWIDGHQNLQLMRAKVRLIPGCAENIDEWIQWMKWPRTAEGT